MSEVIFRIPSQIQYAYIEIKATHEELGLESVLDAGGISAAYMAYAAKLNEVESEAIRQANAEKAPPKKGKRSVATKGGAEEPPHVDSGSGLSSEAESLIVNELGGVKVEEVKAPWEEPETKTDPKPWQDNATPQVADDDFNFDDF